MLKTTLNYSPTAIKNHNLIDISSVNYFVKNNRQSHLIKLSIPLILVQ